MKKLAAMVACILLLANTAVAHDGEKHKTGHKVDAQMQKLHAMMPMFGVTLAELETALEKEDSTTAEKEAGKILAATSDLKKSKPHKNLKQSNKFREIAAGFENDIKRTAEMANTGDFRKAREAFKRAEEKCAACHALFR